MQQIDLYFDSLDFYPEELFAACRSLGIDYNERTGSSRDGDKFATINVEDPADLFSLGIAYGHALTTKRMESMREGGLLDPERLREYRELRNDD